MQIISEGVMQEKQMDDFDNFYYYHILPILRRYEKIRQRDFNMFLFAESVILFIAISLFFASLKFGIYIGLYIFDFAFISFFTLLLVNHYKKKFKLGVKIRCSEKLKKCFDNLEWGCEHIDESLIKKSELFGEYNEIDFDDTFKCTYKGVDFLITETNMRYAVEKKHNTTYNIFKGAIINFTSNKKIKAHTIITTKGDLYIKNQNSARCKHFLYLLLAVALPAIVDWHWDFVVGFFIGIFAIIFIVFLLNNYLKSKNLQSVKLEDLNFDKRFSVYSKDQIEARYLVTPTFMERLNNLKIKFATNKIKCAFFNSQILFAIPSDKDLFEFGTFYRSLRNKQKVKEFYDEIMAIYNMIDYFKLSEKTGL